MILERISMSFLDFGDDFMISARSFNGLHDFGEDLHWKLPESFWRVSGVFLRVSERCRRVPGYPCEFLERIFNGTRDSG